ncbi:hypothetical protein [Paraburkholderia podalyriae]|uniref:Uncharacterized protein n=2 Tax=Paraburkholderia TaxID=1822464 RepID=A0ABR7PWV8_9BURK|nr:hypothetical protein [Paraburkholderia podalyriae]MBC8750763.1 hypothetical protein [Paraburkholderia podalyriae]
MSIAMMPLRRLAERLLPGNVASSRTAVPGSPHAGGSLTTVPLQWRTHWLAWQFLSWISGTLLAPPFWMVGILLMINAHSDQPFFWSLTMAIVPITNAIAIIHANQRHHRRPFTARWQVGLHYFGGKHADRLHTVHADGGWYTGALQGLVEPLVVTMGASGPAASVLWSGTVIAAFGVLSFAHASILHARLAFEA